MVHGECVLSDRGVINDDAVEILSGVGLLFRWLLMIQRATPM